MAEEFSRAVDDGLKLSKRIYFGKDRAVAPPKLPAPMARSPDALLPTAPMVYAVIYDPGIVDNPDIPSYQPHVYGRCDPPALIPLQMNGVEMEIDCYLDTAFVTVSGSWRLHCVMGSRACDCRIAIPMGHQGSILGVEVTAHRKTYSTQLVVMEDNSVNENATIAQQGGFLKSNIFTLTIPQIDGGTNLSIKIQWSQKIVNCNGELTLNVPFTFPEFVTPAGKKMSKKEKIQINVEAVAGSELLCRTMSHPLKEMRRDAGSIGFLYDSQVLSWSNTDFSFSYAVSTRHIDGGVLLQSASVHDFDQREMFYMYSPGDIQSKKVFRKDIIFVIDISGSMQGKLIDDTKNALSSALSKLNPDDSFNIIAFNGESYLFSKSMEPASSDAVEKATEWMDVNFVIGGGTNISRPLNTAIEMLSGAQSSVPIIFLVTDGTVEDERQICDLVKNHMINEESICPRVYTFGIGSFCNHYFLRMLAAIGRGQYDAAVDVDLIEPRMLTLFEKASSLILANIEMDVLDDIFDQLEVYPSHIPDLSTEGPLILSGRYKGNFPETLKVRGIMADFSEFVIDMKIQTAKDIPVQRVCARDQIEHLTAQAWLSENKQLEQQVAKLSLQTGFMSEYTRMVVLENDHLKKAKESAGGKEVSKKSHAPHEANTNVQGQRMILLPHIGVGFGNLTATAENTPPGAEKMLEMPEIFKAASNCCSTLCSYCCCMCCIQCFTRMNNQCLTALTQLCVGIGCFGCLTCCSDICCGGNDS